ncbi:MAG: cadherin-like beta sandwich domain-containing protein, partial [Balneolales bacterium]
ILTFGAGSQGQLGHGDNDDRFEPVELTAASLNGKTISDIDGGVIHSIILASDGTVFTFGNGTKGRLGHGDDDNKNVPTEITEFLSPPQTQASDIVISEVTNNQMNISWTNGDGANRIVFMKEGADGTAEPVNQTSYDADQTIGNGDQIDASGWFAVYNGIKNETIVTDLSAQTEYIVQIFEYNGEGGTEVYLGSAANDNPKVQKTESSFDGGNGSEADPFLISTPEQLPEIINHPDMNYELMADLDLDVPPYNTGSGWDPIGSPGTFFNGTFNGNGHSITGLYIDRPGEDMVGFFGMTSEDALIENIIIEGADVTGKDHVGVIAGINIGTIKTSFTNGTVKGNANIGGLVGSNTGDIADSYSLADVNADQAPAGGLVSMNFEGVITNSYSAGAVAGDDPEIGGLVGINEDGTVTTSFWDTESSGQDDSAGGEGKTTAEMHDVTTFENEGWDFEEDWGINSEKNGGYPFLNLQDYDHNPRGESAKLADLSVDPGEIIFDAEKIAYENVSIPNGTEHVEITFSADGEAAADQDSPQTVEVSDGKANFSVEVTSENGQQTRKYTIQFIELPEEVALLAPEQESNSVGLLPLFSWEENELAKSYELQVADNNDFSDPVILEFVTDMTEFQTEEDLNRDTDYVWRVRAINDGGEGGWSEIYSFVTMGISGQVSLVSPADSSGGIALYPELNWAAAETADSYRIQIYSSDDELVYEAEGLTGNNHTLEEKLSHHVTYQWRVQAENSGGAGEWSGWRHFVTLGEVPDVRFPAGDMENISIAPRLSWNSPYEDGQFQVQLSSDDSFTDILMDTTVNNFFVDVEGLLDESEYFWKVRFEDDLTQSLWSGAASFITRPRPEARESIEVTVDFGGTQDESGVVVSSDYRLIGAPGTDVIALDEVFQQEYNEVWKAFYDNGDESDYFVEYSEGDDNFNFSPGRGFWVLSTKVVELQREIDNVTVNHRDNFPIELNPGWNIISNPHLVDVKWSEVLELNNLDEPLYSYDASFEEAGMMIPFEGYYFYNSAELSLDTLEIPYSNLGRRGRDESPEAKEETDPGVQVQADFRDDEGNDTQVSVELMYPEVVNNETRRVSYHPSLEFSRYGVML